MGFRYNENINKEVRGIDLRYVWSVGQKPNILFGCGFSIQCLCEGPHIDSMYFSADGVACDAVGIFFAGFIVAK